MKPLARAAMIERFVAALAATTQPQGDDYDTLTQWAEGVVDRANVLADAIESREAMLREVARLDAEEKANGTTLRDVLERRKKQQQEGV